MDIPELKHLLESVGLDLQLPDADNIAAEILQGAPQGKITFDYLKQTMQYQRFFSIQVNIHGTFKEHSVCSTSGSSASR
jgi:hypothetical protein